MQFVASDNLGVLGPIADQTNFVVECDHADFAVFSTGSHLLNLTLNGRLHTLQSRHVSHSFVVLIEVLVRPIAKLGKCVLVLFLAIAFEAEFALDRLSDAHGARNIKTKDHRDVLSLHLLVLNLCSRFNQIGHGLRLGSLFVVQRHHFVSSVAELTVPHRLVLISGDNRLVVHHALAALAELSVASRDLGLRIQTVQRYLKHVGVNFDIVLRSFGLLAALLALLAFDLLHLNALPGIGLVIGVVHIALKVVGVDLLAGHVALQVDLLIHLLFAAAVRVAVHKLLLLHNRLLNPAEVEQVCGLLEECRLRLGFGLSYHRHRLGVRERHRLWVHEHLWGLDLLLGQDAWAF